MKKLPKASIQQIFARLQAANPHPTTELIYHNPFELLIAVMLSAQTTDIAVNKATQQFFPQYGSAEKLLGVGESALKEWIRGIGLYNNKAKNVMATCQILLDTYQGEVPSDRDALEALPGVGRKTANVVLNTAFGLPTMAVDTHIFRVSNRIGLTQGKTVRAVEDQLVANIPTAYLKDAHHWLILHGRYCCTARRPKCSACLISDLCRFPDKE